VRAIDLTVAAVVVLTYPASGFVRIRMPASGPSAAPPSAVAVCAEPHDGHTMNFITDEYPQDEHFQVTEFLPMPPIIPWCPGRSTVDRGTNWR
jgi:hypothetical protein